MKAVLWRASARHMLRHPWQVVLGALGIAMGIAVVTAIDAVESSARRAFQDATDTVAGRTTHQVLGGPAGVDEGVYVELRRRLPELAMAPVVEGILRIPGPPGGALRLLGVDPFAEAPFRPYWRRSGARSGDTLVRLLTQARTALISRAAAEHFGVGPGERIRTGEGASAQSVEILGFLEPRQAETATSATELLVSDIATAQELMQRFGRISRIDLILAGNDQVRRVEAALAAISPALELVRSDTRTRSLQGMTRAFHTNLSALSLLALLVGIFLIYNSQSFLVVQRRQQFGALRTIGVHGHQLARIVLAEALCFGLVGALIGIVFGTLLAGTLIGMVTQTINDLYYPLSVAGVSLEPRAYAKALLLAFGATTVAALAPAAEAARVEPRVALSRAALEQRTARMVRLAALAGLAALLASLAAFALPGRGIVTGFAGLFLMVFGGALLTPAATAASLRVLGSVAPRRQTLPLRIGLRSVQASLSRTAVAVAALMLAVATTLGIGVMVESFRNSVSDWLGSVLKADYYVTRIGTEDSYASAAFPLAVAAQLQQLPGVAAVSHVRRTRIESQRGTVALAAYGFTEEARRGFRLRAVADADRFWRRFESDAVVMVSEPFAFHHRLRPGDDIVLRTDVGDQSFEIGAVFQDYASDVGSVAISRAVYDRYWHDDTLTGIGIYTAPDFRLDTLYRELERIGGTAYSFETIANRTIRENSLRVFDRTFRITDVLRLLAGLIAIIGIFSALMAIQLERRRELGIFKAIGFTPAQIRHMVLGETGLIGLVAGVLAVPVGIGMAAVLIHVINRRSFGWTMDMSIDLWTFAGALLLAVLTAVLAGLYPAQRMSRTQPATALRNE